MKNTFSFFLPTRKGSERVISKNTKPFAGVEGGIFELKIRQLIQSKKIDEIIVSTNDESCIEIASHYLSQDSRLKIIPRPQELCLSTTNLSDLIKYVPEIVSANNILWGHATTPIADQFDYDLGIEAYENGLKNGFDSLISVMPFQNFLLDKNAEVINKNKSNLRWPRTQDLIPLFEINHVMFIAPTNIYVNQCDRVGQRPFLFEMDKIKSLDVDWEEDFLIAEAVYEKIKGI